MEYEKEMMKESMNVVGIDDITVEISRIDNAWLTSRNAMESDNRRENSEREDIPWRGLLAIYQIFIKWQHDFNVELSITFPIE